MNQKTKFVLAVTTTVATVTMLMFGDNIFSRIMGGDNKSSTEIVAPKGSVLTVVVYRRAKGGYASFSNIGQQLEALGFKVIRWQTRGTHGGMEKAWGVSPDMFDSNQGGIYFFREHREKAEMIQQFLTRKSPNLAKTIPLVEARSGTRGLFIHTHALSDDSILVYAPG